MHGLQLHSNSFNYTRNWKRKFIWSDETGRWKEHASIAISLARWSKRRRRGRVSEQGKIQKFSRF